MTILRANFADLNDKNFSKIFTTGLATIPQIYSQVCNIVSIDGQYTQMSGVTGLGYIPSKVEGTAITADDIYQKYDKKFTPTTYSLLVRVTKEAWEDDKTGKFNQIPKMASRSLMGTIEYQFARILDLSQTTAGPDGLALCSESHIRADGSATTDSNMPSANVDLGITGLEGGIVQGGALLDDRGLPFPVRYKYLVTAPANEVTARKLLETKEMPGGANNDLNVVSTMGMKLLIDPYLTDTDGWYLIADKADNQLMFVNRVAPQQSTDNDTTNDDGLFKCRARFAVGWVDWRGVYGSTGA